MSAPTIYRDIVYTTTPQRELHLDLHLPLKQGGGPLPVVLFNPMGGMRVCEKENAPRWLAGHGFAMASIECRVRSEAYAPAPVYDTKAAVRWLRANGPRYGLNPNAIGIWGRSAGGLLASLIATSGDRPELLDGYEGSVSNAVQAACDECGAPHDFEFFTRPDIKSKYSGVAENLRLYLGGEIEEKIELARLVSPSTYISSQCPPMLLLHGDADTVVPWEETADFHQRLLDAGVDSTLRIIPGSGHAIDETTVRDDILGFFRRTLA